MAADVVIRPGVIRSRRTDRGQHRAQSDAAGSKRSKLLVLPGVLTAVSMCERAIEITFTATGTVVWSERRQCGPDGGRVSGFGSVVATKPVPSAGPGALIRLHRLADGQTSAAFLIGRRTDFHGPCRWPVAAGDQRR